MKQYTLLVTPDAEADLNELDDYITYELYAPETAAKYVAYIKDRILELAHAPKRYRIIDDEPWHSRKVRRMNANNFAVFFMIDEERNEVYVLNVIYQKRDIPNIL